MVKCGIILRQKICQFTNPKERLLLFLSGQIVKINYIRILKSTNEEWTPEWANSTDDLMTPVKLDPDPDDIPKIEKKDNPFW